MTWLLVTVALTVAALSGAALLTALGFRLGDRRGDAAAEVHAVGSRQAEGCLPVAVVSVANPGTVPVIVSVTSRPLSRLAAATAQPVALRAPLRPRRPRPVEGALLGAVDAASTRTWQVPAAAGPGGAALTVRLDQGRGRTRLSTHALGARALPEAPRRALDAPPTHRRAARR